MKQYWTKSELEDEWTLSAHDIKCLGKKTGANRLAFALKLKYFQLSYRFLKTASEIPFGVLHHVARQLGIASEVILQYEWKSRKAREHDTQIRRFLGVRTATRSDANKLLHWLTTIAIPKGFRRDQLTEKAQTYFKELHIEPFSEPQLDRYIGSALRHHEEGIFEQVFSKLSEETKNGLDNLLIDRTNTDKAENTWLCELKTGVGPVNRESVSRELEKLRRLEGLLLPEDLCGNINYKILMRYRLRVANESPGELRARIAVTRYGILAIFCHLRKQEIRDDLCDLLVQIVHKISVKAEKKTVQEFIADVRKVGSKNFLLFQLSDTALNNPNGTIKDTIFPIVSEDILKSIVKEFKSSGPFYKEKVQFNMRASYGHHYRRLLSSILSSTDFCSNNQASASLIKAVEIVKKYRDTKMVFYPTNEDIPIQGVIRPSLKAMVLEPMLGHNRVNRINYEIAVLKRLRERLRCREIFVPKAYRYRNPDDDLPSDFEKGKAQYFSDLKQPVNPDAFVDNLQKTMHEHLLMLNDGLPSNTKVKFLKKNGGHISLTPLAPQDEPKNIDQLKQEITLRWPSTSLLDVLKEADFRVSFTKGFKSTASKEILDQKTLQKRLLLCLFALGTNTGLKRVSSGRHGINYSDLRYVRRRFITKDYLQSAIREVVNSIFAERKPYIWGEATTACASDSKKFGSWDQNLMTEWHVRYGGRGVMIYWHVDKKSACIYSQLKTCSSSEVGAMIEGVLRHCTSMNVKKNYVDSHGQSEVAFAFAHILGFDLLPRLKAIHQQKLYRAFSGASDSLKNLSPVLTRPINWSLIKAHYEQIIKYATALRIGSAEPEALLRRFVRDNIQHPTYQAIMELGKAVKTIFLCRYLHSEELRREIQEGLNVVERWNSVNGFIFYGKSSEISSNRKEEQEISALALHLLQISLVYINTLMIQNILKDPVWLSSLEPEDKRALSPLIYNHINPYGDFELNMNERLGIDDWRIAA